MQPINSPYWHPVNQRGFILDWDGVLAETRLDFSPIYKRFFDDQKVMILEEAAKLPEMKRKMLYEAVEAIEMEGAKRAEPVDGALELVSWLEKHNVSWAVVSRNTRQCVELAAEVSSIKLPPIVITRDDGLLKPDPRVFLKASELLGKKASQCVVIGDYLYDIVGARRASMRAVLVMRADEPWSVWSDLACINVIELVDILKNPCPLVPWEYQPVIEKRGRRWLESVFGLAVRLPKENYFEILAHLAGLGVGKFCVCEGRLEADVWRRYPYVDPRYLWEPLERVVEDFLKSRFPLARVVKDESAVVLNDNLQENLALIEELVPQ